MNVSLSYSPDNLSDFLAALAAVSASNVAPLVSLSRPAPADEVGQWEALYRQANLPAFRFTSARQAEFGTREAYCQAMVMANNPDTLEPPPAEIEDTSADYALSDVFQEDIEGLH